MIAPYFLLLWGMMFNDGHAENHDETLKSKESCITQAHVRWTDFYRNKKDKVSTFTAICRRKDNNYEFFYIVCDKNGACNI